MQSFKNLEQEVTFTLSQNQQKLRKKVGYEAHLGLACWVI